MMAAEMDCMESYPLFSLLVRSFRLRYLLNLNLSFSFCETKTMATKRCDKQVMSCLQSTSLDYFNNSPHCYFWNQTSERLWWSLPERGLKYQTAPPVKRADSETQFHGEQGVWFPISWGNKSPNTSCTPPIQVHSNTVCLREPQLPQEDTRLSQIQRPIPSPGSHLGSWLPGYILESLSLDFRHQVQVQVVTCTQRNWLQIRRPQNPLLGVY